MTTQFTYLTEKILAGSTQYNRIKSTFTLIQYYDCWTDECGTFLIILALKSMRNPQGRHWLYFMWASALILADSGVTITPSDCTHTLLSLLTAFVHLKFWEKPNKSSSLEPKSSVYIKRTAQRIQLSPRKHSKCVKNKLTSAHCTAPKFNAIVLSELC